MKTPIDEYLAEQADLSAVERFARADVAQRSDTWQDLIPLSAPPEGEQFRFGVDLDQCTGCKSCVTACHNLNGLDVGESFRSIGVLVADPVRAPATIPAQQTVTTACHHCAEPGCLTGCPAEAYEKDPVTGIVKHLDDACIGCRYCTLTCPYEVPVYNHRLGIVRKCDMCADRLSDGEAPACVQGCPTDAISISTVAVDVPTASEPSRLVPGAARSELTRPTTVYSGTALRTETSALDAQSVQPQHEHLPLVVLLVLSQTSVGVIAAALGLAIAGTSEPLQLSMIVGAALAVCSVVASVGHLGQPLKAWRVVLGWSHSWLSREAIVLGAYVGAVLGSVVAFAANDNAGVMLLTVAVVLGVAAVFCSAMIYVVTDRRWWRLGDTFARFVGTVIIAGAGWASFAALADAELGLARAGSAVVVLGVGVKLWIERRVLSATDVDLQRTATLLRGQLATRATLRTVSAVSGALLIALGAFGAGDRPERGAVLALVGLVAVTFGEISERRLFFRACAPLTMPGAQR